MQLLPSKSSVAKSPASSPADQSEQIQSEAQLVADGQRVVYATEDGEQVTAREIIALCRGNVGAALRLLHLCEWQHPETLLDEDENLSPADQCFPELWRPRRAKPAVKR
jgi:hypothetical protein